MKITDRIYSLETSKGAHSFLITDSSNILIDTGMPSSVNERLKEISDLGISKDSITDILLTHFDVDHAGNVAALQKATGAAVWIDPKDEPYLMNRKRRSGIKQLIQMILRPEPPVSCHKLDCHSVAGVEVIPAPGHTPGHCMFFFDGVLFSGDMIRTSGGKLSIMSDIMNWDSNVLRASMRCIADIDFEWLCPSHGDPIRNDVTLQNFIRKESDGYGSRK